MIGRFTIETAADSALHALGVHDPATPPWDRPAPHDKHTPGPAAQDRTTTALPRARRPTPLHIIGITGHVQRGPGSRGPVTGQAGPYLVNRPGESGDLLV